ncbi:MAG TPA: hypothetical protein VFK06_16685 [Candidatus Angelobacter sp.]|nr:hypothetical protein [Candidatus Angelobacter sp.]
MSEYQYYEFRAIDRALTKKEMAELRAISTRAVITPASFTNHYEWGDLKADPFDLLEKYFDVFLYIANWGTRELHLRLPLELADYKKLKAMLPGESVQVRKSRRGLILSFAGSELDYDDMDDGEGWMDVLASLRSDVLRGDLRCLYLGWLLCAQHEELDGNELEPPVPEGLRDLSAPLQSLIEFHDLDENLVEVAAQVSAPLKAGPDQKELAAWIRGLPEKEKNDLLATAICESGEIWKAELLRRFQKQETLGTSSQPAATRRRTAAELLGTIRTRDEERDKRAEEQRAADAARIRAKLAVAREHYLQLLEKRQSETWARITAHIQTRQPNGYDQAVSLLADLRDVALRQGRTASFHTALEKLRLEHAAKGNFLHRLEKAEL